MFSVQCKGAQHHKTTVKQDRHRWNSNSLIATEKAHLAKSLCPLLTQCSALDLSGQSTATSATVRTLINKSFQPISDGCVLKNKKMCVFVDQCCLPLSLFFSPDSWLMFRRFICCTHTPTWDVGEIKQRGWSEERNERKETKKRQIKDWQQMIEKRTRARENRRVVIACNQKQDSGNRFNLMLSLFFFFCVCVCVCWQIWYCFSLETGYRKTHSVII